MLGEIGTIEAGRVLQDMDDKNSNQCNDILRQRKKVYPVEEVRETARPSDEYENIEWMEMLNGLDEKYRMVMILYYVNGLKTTEISDILHMPVSTVRTRLSRGRNQMTSLYHERR